MRSCVILSRWVRPSVSGLAMAIAGASPFIAHAEEAGGARAAETSTNSGDIVVTARKRDETLMAVPVVVSVVGAAEIERRALNGLDVIAHAAPGLIIGEGGGTVQGGNIVIRGIAGADTNTFAEHPVSINMDGVQVARALVRRLGEFDLQQVEVLKGPQTLFFGKNSPGGVISIRTADPTDQFEAKLQAGYEFNAHEFRGEGFVSIPISEGVGIRFAGYTSLLRGYAKNIVPSTSPFDPPRTWGPRNREYAGRITFKYDKGGPFNAKLKLNYNHSSGDSPSFNYQLVDCPLGGAQPVSFPTVDNCRADNKTSTGDPNGAFNGVDPRFAAHGGHNFQTLSQFLGGLELNYSPTDEITITSVSGAYIAHLESQGNFTMSYNPATFFESNFNPLRFREFSQEIRVASSFDGPLNFVMGGYAQHSDSLVDQQGASNATTPSAGQHYRYRQKGTAFSGFGQLIWNVVPTFELAVGGRYSWEKKRLVLAAVNVAGTALTVVEPTQDRLTFNDFSPELTGTWRPSQNLTIFGGYRRGFLSGGFNAAGATTVNNTYRPQTTKGFEGGIKARLLNGALRASMAAYDYKVKDLQTTVTVQGVISELRNAAAARIKGLEWDLNYDTPLKGLTLSAAAAYTHARYQDYIASCYRGQLTPDCSNRISPITGQLALSQDLSGRQVVRAPDWSGNVGFSYEQPVGGGLKFGLSGDMTFTSSYYGEPTLKPASKQGAFQLFDATVRVADENDRWEVALIGKNLTNEYFWVRSSDRPFTGSSPGCSPTPQAGAGCSAAAIANPTLADTVAVINRGREIMLRVTARFGR